MNRNVLFLLFLSLFLTTNTATSQGALNYQLAVNDNQGQPKSNLDIVLIETSTFQRKEFKTGADGRLLIELTEGAEWMLNIGEMKNWALLQVPQGTTGSGSAMTTYNVERWNRINQKPVDRSKLNLEVEKQQVSGRDMPSTGKSILEIIAVNENDRPWQGIPVQLTCFALNKTFSAQTDGKGVARFDVPNNQTYQIDLDGEDDFEYIDAGNRSTIKGVTVTYEKINFTESRDSEGAVVQKFTVDPKPVSNRVMVTLYVQGGSKNGRNEDVYLDMTYSNERYHGVTDDQGKVVFLLPKKRSYLVSFPFQKNADILDLTRFRGIGFMESGLRYDPDPRFEFPERYLPTVSELKSYDINSTLTERYPDTPDDELINVHVKWGNNKINSGSKEALLELGFSVKEKTVDEEKLKPLNITFVLDKSGSMGGENIDFLKEAMHQFIAKLRPIDKVSIVFFDTQAVVAYPQAAPKKNEMTDVIHALSAGGGTSIYDGLKLGYEEISKSYNRDHINRVILLTDGYGSQPVDFVVEQSKKYFDKGIAVSTIGVGMDYNSALLTLLSKYSGGFEHQVIQSEGISEALEAEFGSFSHPLASDLRIKVKYNNRVIYKTLYGVPESKNTNNMVEFKLGEVYTTLNKMALMKFKIENPDRDIDKNKVTIQINYFDERKQTDVEIVKEAELEWTDETDAELIHDEQLKTTYSVAVINQALKAIADLCDAENFEAASDNVNATLKSIKKVTDGKYSDDLKPFIDELEGYLVALKRAIKNRG